MKCGESKKKADVSKIQKNRETDEWKKLQNSIAHLKGRWFGSFYKNLWIMDLVSKSVWSFAVEKREKYCISSSATERNDVV